MERIKTEYYPDWEELLTSVITDKNKSTKEKTLSEKATENGDTAEKPVENGENTKTATENRETGRATMTENGKTEVAAT